MAEELIASPNSEEAKTGGGLGFMEWGEHEGKKTLLLIGFTRSTASTGTRILKLRAVCLEDPQNDGADVGKDFEGKFFLTKAAIGRFSRLVFSANYSDDVNVLDNDSVERFVCNSKPFLGKVIREDPWTTEDADGNEIVKEGRLNIAFTDPMEEALSISEDEANELIAAASDRFDKYSDWLLKKQEEDESYGY